MLYKELKIKSEAELEKLLKERREALRELRFNVFQGQLKSVRQVRNIKKTIARILTVLNVKKSPADNL